MKKIAIWKVIVLSIITLGVYSIVWFALRRNELATNYKQKVPHWLWLIAPGVIAVVAWIASLFGIVAYTQDPGTTYDLMMISLFVFVLTPFFINLWWMYRFGKSVELVTGGRVPAVWTAALYFFIGPAVSIVHQYYTNRIETLQPIAKIKVVGPSQRFTMTAWIIVVLSAVMAAASWATVPADYQKGREEAIRTMPTRDQ